jgi:hypothetical protein
MFFILLPPSPGQHFYSLLHNRKLIHEHVYNGVLDIWLWNWSQCNVTPNMGDIYNTNNITYIVCSPPPPLSGKLMTSTVLYQLIVTYTCWNVPRPSWNVITQPCVHSHVTRASYTKSCTLKSGNLLTLFNVLINLTHVYIPALVLQGWRHLP